MSGTRVDWTRLTVERHTDFDVTDPQTARLPRDAQDEQDELNNLNLEPEPQDLRENPCPMCAEGELEGVGGGIPVMECDHCGHVESL